ncbi:MAG: hypothetical protein LBL04_13765, partial [Bacteroidales bacterium]|nr:hypothetical protein [Bacteroidales bacterium]
RPDRVDRPVRVKTANTSTTAVRVKTADRAAFPVSGENFPAVSALSRTGRDVACHVSTTQPDRSAYRTEW